MNTLTPNELKLCQLQGKIFESSIDHSLTSSPIFIRRFMFSNLAKTFDDFSFLNMSLGSIESVGEVDDEYNLLSYGKTKYSKDEMYWIGYIYRVICIKYNLRSKTVFKYFSARKMIEFYNVYHTFDVVYAAERMLENINYDFSSIEEKAYKLMKRYVVFNNEKLE